MDPDSVERYDRQIRLWGQHGQNKCSTSNICLINANSLGTEILKGLCLAGIGSFTILDSNKLLAEDVGSTLLTYSQIGKNRAECVKEMLLDINEEVTGEVYPLETYLPHVSQDEIPVNQDDCDKTNDSDDSSRDIRFWRQFNCVIASGFLYMDQVTRLSKICWAINVPLILCKSIGFYGFMRSQIREHLVIETHPDNVLPDFNIDQPFPSLKSYLDSIDIDDSSTISKLSSYPYIVIIYKYLKRWQALNGYPDNRFPENYSEKKALKSLIDGGLKLARSRKKSIDAETNIASGSSVSDHEIPFENYMEASKSVNVCFTSSSKLPDSVQSLFNHTKVTNPPINNGSTFWLIIRAIKHFVLEKNNLRLPVSGLIPDMISSSEEYIRLQSIYSQKAREDVDSVFALVEKFARSSPNYQPGVSLLEETKLVCKNIRDIRVLSTSPIHEEYDLKSRAMLEEVEEDEFITIGLCVKALDLFFSTYGRLPGCQDDQVEPDIIKLKDCLKQLMGQKSCRLRTLDQCLYELCRYGGCELHATSAFLGGCIAQEVIKLVTNQYVPVDNAFVYNAMAASTKSFRLDDAFAKA